MTGYVSGETDYQVITLGLVQLVVDDYMANHRGFDLGSTTYRTYQTRKQLFAEDRDPLVVDGSSWISQQVAYLTPKTRLDYPVMYRMLANGDLLIGIDERDLNDDHCVSDRSLGVDPSEV